MFKTKKILYISLFALLYLITAGSSFIHAISFFGLANNSWMSLILAFAFELGQAVTLFSLLTSQKDRNRIMPWVLMTMFTLVQVVGNVFSSYKHIITNSVENLKYFKEPIFIWTDLPDQEATVIVTWAIGAILPIAALLITSMITNYLSDQSDKKLLENKENQFLNNGEDSLLNQNSILHMENQGLQEQIDKLKEDLEKKNDSLESFGEAVENRDNHIENLEKELENLKNTSDINEEIKKENEELKEKNDELVSKGEELVQSVAKLESDNEALRKSDETYKKAYTEVNNENTNLKEEIVKLQDKLLELENGRKQEDKSNNNDGSEQQLDRTESETNTKMENNSNESKEGTIRDNRNIIDDNDKNIQLADVLMGGNILKEKNKKPSHFIN